MDLKETVAKKEETGTLKPDKTKKPSGVKKVISEMNLKILTNVRDNYATVCGNWAMTSVSSWIILKRQLRCEALNSYSRNSNVLW